MSLALFSLGRIYIPYIPPSAWEQRERKDSEEVGGEGRETDASTTPSPNKKVLRRTLEEGGRQSRKRQKSIILLPPRGRKEEVHSETFNAFKYNYNFS